MDHHTQKADPYQAILEGFNNLAASVLRLARAIETQAECQQTKQILERICQSERNVVSVISEFAAKQKAFNDKQSASIDGLVSSASGLTADVQALNDKITELQNSQGGVTPEDQALITDLEAQGEALATKLEGVASALSALDAQTPPVVPPGT